jgi:hypothetical protein
MNKNITVKPTIIKPLISVNPETKKPSKMNNFLDVYYKLKITPEFYSSVIKGV